MTSEYTQKPQGVYAFVNVLYSVSIPTALAETGSV